MEDITYTYVGFAAFVDQGLHSATNNSNSFIFYVFYYSSILRVLMKLYLKTILKLVYFLIGLTTLGELAKNQLKSTSKVTRRIGGRLRNPFLIFL